MAIYIDTPWRNSYSAENVIPLSLRRNFNYSVMEIRLVVDTYVEDVGTLESWLPQVQQEEMSCLRKELRIFRVVGLLNIGTK